VIVGVVKASNKKHLQNGVEIGISGIIYPKNSDFLGLSLKT
jgi:hypothetical protein